MFPFGPRVHADEVSATEVLVLIRGTETGLSPPSTGPTVGAPTPGTLPRVRVTVETERYFAVLTDFNTAHGVFASLKARQYPSRNASSSAGSLPRPPCLPPLYNVRCAKYSRANQHSVAFVLR